MPLLGDKQEAPVCLSCLPCKVGLLLGLLLIALFRAPSEITCTECFAGAWLPRAPVYVSRWKKGERSLARDADAQPSLHPWYVAWSGLAPQITRVLQQEAVRRGRSPGLLNPRPAVEVEPVT